jgi:hypothetical protein
VLTQRLPPTTSPAAAADHQLATRSALQQPFAIGGVQPQRQALPACIEQAHVLSDHRGRPRPSW